jgi:hypothetical protein
MLHRMNRTSGISSLLSRHKYVFQQAVDLQARGDGPCSPAGTASSQPASTRATGHPRIQVGIQGTDVLRKIKLSRTCVPCVSDLAVPGTVTWVPSTGMSSGPGTGGAPSANLPFTSSHAGVRVRPPVSFIPPAFWVAPLRQHRCCLRVSCRLQQQVSAISSVGLG